MFIYTNLATSQIFTSYDLVLTSVDLVIDTKLNSRLITLQQMS